MADINIPFISNNIGNIGIGTDSPMELFHVSGVITASKVSASLFKGDLDGTAYLAISSSFVSSSISSSYTHKAQSSVFASQSLWAVSSSWTSASLTSITSSYTHRAENSIFTSQSRWAISSSWTSASLTSVTSSYTHKAESSVFASQSRWAVSASFASSSISSSYSLHSLSSSYSTVVESFQTNTISSSYASSSTSASMVVTLGPNITNNVDNRLLTATGGGTINAEVNLTYNSSSFTILNSNINLSSVDSGSVSTGFRMDSGEGFTIYGNNSFFGDNQDAIIFQMEDLTNWSGTTDGGFVFRGWSPSSSGSNATASNWMTIKSGPSIGIGTMYPVSSLQIVGHVSASSFGSGSFHGTASYANRSNVSSVTLYASQSQWSVSSSFVSSSVSSSYTHKAESAMFASQSRWAISASWASSSVSSSLAITAQNLSQATYNISVMFASQSRWAISASWASSSLTASYVEGAVPIFTGKSDNYLPKWSSNTLTGTSNVYDDGTNVGIGTNNPIYSLTVRETANSAVLGLIVDDASSRIPGVYLINNSSVEGTFRLEQSTESPHSVIIEAGTAGSTYTAIKASGSSVLQLMPGGGFVGIGKTNPIYKLDVQDSIRISGSNAYLWHSNGQILIGADTTGYYICGGSSGPNLPIIFGNNDAKSITFSTINSGVYFTQSKFGIDVPNPLAKLHVLGYVSASGFGSGSLMGTASYADRGNVSSTSFFASQSFWAVSSSWASSSISASYSHKAESSMFSSQSRWNISSSFASKSYSSDTLQGTSSAYFTLRPINTQISGNAVMSADTRNDNYSPLDRSAGIYFDFKSNSADGLSNSITYPYHGNITFRPYGNGIDTSGGPSHQLGFTDADNLWMRTSELVNSGSWGSWNKFVKEGTNNPFNITSSFANTSRNSTFASSSVSSSYLSGSNAYLKNIYFNGDFANIVESSVNTLSVYGLNGVNLTADQVRIDTAVIPRNNNLFYVDGGMFAYNVTASRLLGTSSYADVGVSSFFASQSRWTTSASFASRSITTATASHLFNILGNVWTENNLLPVHNNLVIGRSGNEFLNGYINTINILGVNSDTFLPVTFSCNINPEGTGLTVGEVNNPWETVYANNLSGTASYALRSNFAQSNLTSSWASRSFNSTSASYSVTASTVAGNSMVVGGVLYNKSTVQVNLNFTDYPLFDMATGSYRSVHVDYNVVSSIGSRAGSMVGLWNNGLIRFNEVCTIDMGSVSELQLSMSLGGGNVQLIAKSESGVGYTVNTANRFM